MTSSRPLVERKQRQARQRIIEAAQELFREHGFNGVSVGDIAERAEVGRTTFFRHFHDKQEVVFAREQELLDTITAAGQTDDAAPPRSVSEAVEQLGPILLTLCARASVDPKGYTDHFALIERHPELRDRDAAKVQQVGDRLSELLVRRGADEATAVLAGQIALACFQTARRLGNNPHTLVDDTRAALTRTLALGTSATGTTTR
ncbi:TetR/AcrR family transcriptional regulator [Streptomyces sp. 8L]|uniref:TetR/AcrR family transcriptional regulator n=1 Tax=Streptomyces sp. 8L TaxID=2877242 RepID=UPI001CD4B38F|nr:TetR/AcrR family transcriptional regulator [Streptomyces sp. 8L]MCA1218728.1 TetR/AcrR family transcriptional regulator [Streptomyces sp. 8L]